MTSSGSITFSIHGRRGSSATLTMWNREERNPGTIRCERSGPWQADEQRFQPKWWSSSPLFGIGVVLLAALGGASQGFVWSGLSLAGLVTGAVIGGRLAPLLLTGGASSPYSPVFAVAGAVTLAVAFEVVGSTVGAVLRGRQNRRFLRDLDSAAGVVAGALVGLAVVWVLGAMVLQLPGQAQLRRAVQRSELLQRLNAIVPPRSLLNALGRIDPFPRLTGPPVPTEPPDTRKTVLSTLCPAGSARRRGCLARTPTGAVQSRGR